MVSAIQNDILEKLNYPVFKEIKKINENFAQIKQKNNFELSKNFKEIITNSDNIKSMTGNFKQIADVSNQMQEIIKNIAINIDADKFNKFKDNVNSFFDNFSNMLNKNASKILEFKERIEFIQSIFDEVFRISIEEQTFLFPSIGNLYFSDLIKIAGKIVEKKSIFSFYEGYFSDKENLKFLLDNWCKSDFFTQRRPILEDCLNAHLDNKHTLSIPIFFIQIEGYCKHIANKREWKVCFDDIKTKLESDLDNEIKQDILNEKRHSILVIDQLLKVVFEKEKIYETLENPTMLNRHDVCHGKNISYFRDKNASIKCILILDVLYNFFESGNNKASESSTRDVFSRYNNKLKKRYERSI